MGFLARIFLGDGTLRPELVAELEAEGLVLVEEGLVGSVRYDHFRAPGKRFNGKITGVCVGVGISEARLVAYCRSGRSKLIDSRFDEPRLRNVAIEVEDGEAIVFVIDYAKIDVPDVSGIVRIRARTARAAEIAEQVQARL